MVEREIDMEFVLGTKYQTGYAKSFVENLIKVTQSKDIVEAFDKIEPLYDNDISILGDHCLCGHPITVVFYVLNTVTNEKLKIGCECIKKFDRYQIETEKWLPFIEFATARVKLINIVKDIVSNPEKIYTLRRRRSFVDLLIEANITKVLPPAFDDKYKPLELVKLDNYKCIRDIIAELNIPNIDIEPLKLMLVSKNWKESRNNKALYNIWQSVIRGDKDILTYIDVILHNRRYEIDTEAQNAIQTTIKYTKSHILRFFLDYFNSKTHRIIIQ